METGGIGQIQEAITEHTAHPAKCPINVDVDVEMGTESEDEHTIARRLPPSEMHGNQVRAEQYWSAGSMALETATTPGGLPASTTLDLAEGETSKHPPMLALPPIPPSRPVFMAHHRLIQREDHRTPVFPNASQSEARVMGASAPPTALGAMLEPKLPSAVPSIDGHSVSEIHRSALEMRENRVPILAIPPIRPTRPVFTTRRRLTLTEDGQDAILRRPPDPTNAPCFHPPRDDRLIRMEDKVPSRCPTMAWVF
ncbi:hypothetical protein NMY22_g20048 [Coprinellus aureogranulatus]|nr:hypothetical protein NMY22_g20048 [Coprinellus aureogranulatus]